MIPQIYSREQMAQRRTDTRERTRDQKEEKRMMSRSEKEGKSAGAGEREQVR